MGPRRHVRRRVAHRTGDRHERNTWARSRHHPTTDHRCAPDLPGCGGRVDVTAGVHAGRLALTIGLCHSCDDARVRRARGGERLFAHALAGGAAVCVILALLPSLPQAITLAAPPIAAIFAGALLWRRLQSGLVETGQQGGAATPYRSGPSGTLSPAPVALTRAGAHEALLYCANAVWANEFARLNRFESRPPTVRPGVAFGVPLLAIAVALNATAAIFLWSYKWPVVLIDNGSSTDLVVWIDGEPRWQVPPMRGINRPVHTRLSRRVHRVAYLLPSASTPRGEIEVDPSDGFLSWASSWVGRPSRAVYNPGALACYFLYEVTYGNAAPTNLVEEHLPRREWSFVAAEYGLEKPDANVGGKSELVRAVVVRDDECLRSTDPGRVLERRHRRSAEVLCDDENPGRTRGLRTSSQGHLQRGRPDSRLGS